MSLVARRRSKNGLKIHLSQGFRSGGIIFNENTELDDRDLRAQICGLGSISEPPCCSTFNGGVGAGGVGGV
jgi:hypothetical protein